MSETRIAVVTGGAGTLGKAIATELAQNGSKVVLVDLDEGAVRDCAAQISESTHMDVCGWASDVSSDQENLALVERLTIEFGRLDQLINNAARSQASEFGALDREEWQDVMAVNLWGPTSLCQIATPLWRATGGGQVVNVASRTWQSGGPVAYVSSKAGLVGLTRSLAVELGHLNVTVNAIAPSMVLTPFTRRDRSDAQIDAMLQTQQQMSLLPRLATPEDVASAAAFLASPRASFITGEVLHIAGGAQLAPSPH